jgi:hypothetical protein
VIILCVRWYLRYKLSFRDLVEMMSERGLQLAHTTILRWVQRYAPEFIKRWHRFGRLAGRSWRVDETYDDEHDHDSESPLRQNIARVHSEFLEMIEQLLSRSLMPITEG